MRGLRENFDLELDHFVHRHGMRKATEILHSLLHPIKSNVGEMEQKKLIIKYVIMQTAHHFGVKKKDIKSGQSKSAKEARWAAVHILKFYTRFTYKRMGQHFEFNERRLRYASNKCSELLEIPQFEKEFNRKYRKVENKVIAFIGQLN